MISLLRAEALKLRRSLVLLVAATPALMVFALGFLVTISDNGPDNWQIQIMSGSAIWGFFLLPMSAIGLTALHAQLEHAPNTWSHTLALPRPKWQVFLAKAIWAQLILAIVSVLVEDGAVSAYPTVGSMARPVSPAGTSATAPPDRLHPHDRRT